MAKLVVRTEGMPAEVIHLKPGINRLGRSSRNDVQIDHDSISRFHAELELRDDGLFVRDLDSSNGTFVNGEPVTEARLESGQLLQLGDVCLEVREAPEPFAGDAPVCENHPDIVAILVCKQCRRTFCGACVHVLRLEGGRYHRLCPVCSGHCESLAELRRDPGARLKLTDFVRRLFKRPPPPRPYVE
jgi:hypothetical protein